MRSWRWSTTRKFYAWYVYLFNPTNVIFNRIASSLRLRCCTPGSWTKSTYKKNKTWLCFRLEWWQDVVISLCLPKLHSHRRLLRGRQSSPWVSDHASTWRINKLKCQVTTCLINMCLDCHIADEWAWSIYHLLWCFIIFLPPLHKSRPKQEIDFP